MVAASVCGTFLCSTNFRLVGSIWWETRVLPDNSRRRTFRLVVGRLSIGPAGESRYSPGGIISCCSVFCIPPVTCISTPLPASSSVLPVLSSLLLHVFGNITLCPTVFVVVIYPPSFRTAYLHHIYSFVTECTLSSFLTALSQWYWVYGSRYIEL